MIEKIWLFIKENIAVIITVITALFASVYAVLRLCMFVYWKGYFIRLNIDENVMNLNFDKSIFSILFVSIILLIVVFFMSWTYDIINDIIRKIREIDFTGIKKIFNLIKYFGRIIVFSFVVLSIINVPLVVLLFSVTQISSNICSMFLYVVVIYVMEMLFLFSQKIMEKKQDIKEETNEKNIAIKIIQFFAAILIILVMLFDQGSNVIEERKQLQLVENGKYVITYCDGERYVLHEAEYENKTIIVNRNKQKIVSVEDCELTIVEVNDIVIKD